MSDAITRIGEPDDPNRIHPYAHRTRSIHGPLMPVTALVINAFGPRSVAITVFCPSTQYSHDRMLHVAIYRACADIEKRITELRKGLLSRPYLTHRFLANQLRAPAAAAIN